MKGEPGLDHDIFSFFLSFNSSESLRGLIQIYNRAIMDANKMHYGGIMPTNISVKNVPDDLIEKLRIRARRNHRSLQGELMVILEEATGSAAIPLDDAERRLDALRFKTGDDSTTWIRELRDAR
jgi:plasmid stability protein